MEAWKNPFVFATIESFVKLSRKGRRVIQYSRRIRLGCHSKKVERKKEVKLQLRKQRDDNVFCTGDYVISLRARHSRRLCA